MCCVNFGLPNAGPDAFAADDGLLRLVQGARAVVLQIPAAMNLSNSITACTRAGTTVS